MRLALLLAVLSIGCCGACAGNPRPNVSAASRFEPDTSAVLRLGAGNHRLAHGCPLGERIALTNAHVVLTSREFARAGNFDDPAQLFLWATRDEAYTGKTGRVQVDQYRDLAWIESTTGPFPHYYPVASEPPAVGARLLFVGFDFRGRRVAYSERPLIATMIRLSLGRLIYRIDEGVPGSSGSCVFNERGEVVGINSAYNELENGEIVGIGVSIAGMPVPVLPEVQR